MGRISRIEIVANAASGRVGPDAEADARKVMAEAGVTGNVRVCEPKDLGASLRRALDAGPDLLAVVAGDGTARTAAELAGAEGPLLALLPGGTVNLLPRALYGERDWLTALADILREGEERPLACGRAAGRLFLCAALFGSPALWAPAREAVREGSFAKAMRRAQRAWGRAFAHPVSYALEGEEARRAEAVMFMTPLISGALGGEEAGLEATVFAIGDAAQALRLGLHALAGDWRQDPTVEARLVRRGRLWSSGSLPMLLDGEPTFVGRQVEVGFQPAAVRVLV